MSYYGYDDEHEGCQYPFENEIPEGEYCPMCGEPIVEHEESRPGKRDDPAEEAVKSWDNDDETDEDQEEVIW